MTAGTPTRVTRGDQIPATPPSKAKIVGIPTMEVNTMQNTYYNIKPSHSVIMMLLLHLLKIHFHKNIFNYYECTEI